MSSRRIQVFGVGTEKSGTNSVARMFEDNFRSVHEPSYGLLVNFLMRKFAGKVTDEEFERFVIDRVHALDLEVDSAHANMYILPVLVRAFPQASFLLTIRDCFSWLESIISLHMRRGFFGLSWVDARFGGRPRRYPPEEEILKVLHLYRVDGYFNAWAEHIECVLAQVPEDRLLVVPTDQIQEQLGCIADFLGIDPLMLNPDKSHGNPSPGRPFEIVSKIPRAYLVEAARRRCAPIMERFFPTICPW